MTGYLRVDTRPPSQHANQWTYFLGVSDSQVVASFTHKNLVYVVLRRRRRTTLVSHSSQHRIKPHQPYRMQYKDVWRDRDVSVKVFNPMSEQSLPKLLRPRHSDSPWVLNPFNRNLNVVKITLTRISREKSLPELLRP
ncbi:hypothetical protein J6590_014141 [Homalodisca vitripennis]|nr:hypothetical protein J6590_014141 [Homalodisca vitripennis]